MCELDPRDGCVTTANLADYVVAVNAHGERLVSRPSRIADRAGAAVLDPGGGGHRRAEQVAVVGSGGRRGERRNGDHSRQHADEQRGTTPRRGGRHVWSPPRAGDADRYRMKSPPCIAIAVSSTITMSAPGSTVVGVDLDEGVAALLVGAHLALGRELGLTDEVERLVADHVRPGVDVGEVDPVALRPAEVLDQVRRGEKAVVS